MEIPIGLILQPSPIDGLGIFAIKDIPKNTFLGSFEGVTYHISDFKRKYGKNYRYCYKMLRQQKIIVAKEKRNWITFINERRGNPNVILKRKGCLTITDIKKGDELLLDYGNLYPR